MKILERIDECNIGQVNKYRNTALILSCKNNMENVIIEILKYTEDIDIDILNRIVNKDIKKNVFNSYINYQS